MTNSERINSHNALIDEAIAKANALPDAGSGGGGTTGTYTLTLNNDENGSYYGHLLVTVMENGKPTHKCLWFEDEGILTVENVVCGCGVTIFAGCPYSTLIVYPLTCTGVTFVEFLDITDRYPYSLALLEGATEPNSNALILYQ